MKTVLKSLVGLFFLVTVLNTTSCKSDEPKEVESPKVESPKEEEPVFVKQEPQIPEENRAFTWEGTIKGSIPVFIHFTEQDSILSGEITYLNTKAKTPIRIIGEVYPDYYRILEFNKDVLITGIMNLKKNGDKMTGTWYASGNDGSFPMEIEGSDSIVEKTDLSVEPSELFGAYAYKYTEDAGNVGDFTIEKVTAHEAIFGIIGIHSAPGYNIASIEETVVDFPAGSTDLYFDIPEMKSCDFEVKFYKDFAVVRYINGYCTGYFGHNAGVEGIFLKVK